MVKRETLLLLTVLIVSVSASNLEHVSVDKTCILPSKERDYCSVLKHCDKTYYGIARLYYCSKEFPSLPILLLLSLGIFIALAIVLVSLSIIVSNCLFPNIHEISSTFKIKNDILGFVIIPLTNAVPDIINYYIILDSGTNDLVLGQIIGSILIMFTVIIGTISILNSPFKVVNSHSLMIDMTWVLFILMVFSYIMYDAKITLPECIVMISTYVFYILFLNIHNKEFQEDLNIPYGLEEALNLLSPTISPANSPTNSPPPGYQANIEYIEEVLIEDSIGLLQMLTKAIDVICLYLVPVTVNKTSWWFGNSRTAFKVWFAIQIPLLLNYLVFKLEYVDLIPIVLILILVVLAAHVPASFSNLVLNLFGIINSTILISFTSKGVLLLLKNFGLLWRISDYLLGLFVFSISNSINDIITNVTISTRINPILGINACLGTPLLLILLGLGMNGSIIIMQNKGAPIRFTLSTDVVVTVISLIVIITTYILYLPLNKWVWDKRIGYIAISGFFVVSFINLFLKG